MVYSDEFLPFVGVRNDMGSRGDAAPAFVMIVERQDVNRHAILTPMEG
jgi:hypothetical protein